MLRVFYGQLNVLLLSARFEVYNGNLSFKQSMREPFFRQQTTRRVVLRTQDISEAFRSSVNTECRNTECSRNKCRNISLITEGHKSIVTKRGSRTLCGLYGSCIILGKCIILYCDSREARRIPKQ